MMFIHVVRRTCWEDILVIAKVVFLWKRYKYWKHVLSTEEIPSWKDVILAYTQQTTFHGVSFITSKTRYPIRR